MGMYSFLYRYSHTVEVIMDLVWEERLETVETRSIVDLTIRVVILGSEVKETLQQQLDLHQPLHLGLCVKEGLGLKSWTRSHTQQL